MAYTVSRRLVLSLPMLAALKRQGFAEGADWKPAHSVRIVVPQGPGGTTDVMARLLAPRLQARWGQPVVVENKPGAGGVIGTQDAMSSAPDGYTILMGNVGAQAIAYQLVKGLSYKPDDLIPVSDMIDGPNILIVNNSVPANTIPEFVKYLKRTPEASFGTPGIGSTPHLAALWFNKLTGTKSEAVQYKGSGAAMIDLYGGVIQYSFDALVNAIEPIRAGRVKALGVTGRERYPLLPNIPTVHETMPKLKSFVSNTWVGVFVRKGQPAGVEASLHEAAQALLREPDIDNRFLALGGLPMRQTQAEFAQYVRDETTKWANVIREAGLQIEL